MPTLHIFSLYLLDPNYIGFPPQHLADESGLLAIGGDLRPERLLIAYRLGIFPWYADEDPPLWWCPDPRFVLFPDQLKVSKSMKQVLRSGRFHVTVNRAFRSVMENCRSIDRPEQEGTWILPEVIDAYEQLHLDGFAHSVEVWNQTHELVGGLYGIILGQCFFGESMFSLESNASKTGFILLVQKLRQLDFALVDCQIHSDHLERLGAGMIPRQQFLKILDTRCSMQPFPLAQHWD
jgi:leucyl/phenylalanyl-tRNA--protein transferase